MESLSKDLTFNVVVIGFILALIAFFLAKRAGYFRLPSTFFTSNVTLTNVIFAFAIYLILAFIVLPVLLIVVSMPFSTIPGKKIPDEWLKWGQMGFLAILFLCLIVYCFIINRKTAYLIFWGDGKASVKRFFKTFGMGVLTWVISYPIVLFISALTGWLSLKIWGKSESEQVAVLQLKSTINDPLLFTLMILAVSFLVPFMEELLFRGFLQSYLREKFGRLNAIFTTALIFAAVHYSTSQGIGNFQLIISLYVLSLFLGFIYERERTLWAPIGLHCTFNFVNAFLIFLQS